MVFSYVDPCSRDVLGSLLVGQLDMIVMPRRQWLSSMLFQISLHVVSFIGTCNRSDRTRFDLSNEFLFFAIVPATLLFYAHLAATNLALTVNTKTGMNIYIFIVLTNRELIGHW